MANLDSEQNLAGEDVIRSYLLRDLTEKEQIEVENRLLTDEIFFQNLLIVEDELTDDYMFGLLSEHEQEKIRTYFFAAPERYEELRLAEIIDKYISTNKLSISQERPNKETNLQRIKALISALLRVFTWISRQEPAKTELQSSGFLAPNESGMTWEQLLAEAQTNRNLLATLVAGEWLGLHLLAQTRSQPHLTEVEVASRVKASSTDVASILNELVNYDLLYKREGSFYCTKLGTEVLGRIEETFGVTLNL
jgi:hypothetical protein